MFRILTNRGAGPIGVDIGSRSVRLLQFNADRTRVIDAARVNCRRRRKFRRAMRSPH